MKFIREAARFIVGGLFIFSGLIKLNDPTGTAIKLKEYFEVFAIDIAPFFEHFIPAAMFLAIFLSVLEVVLGVAVLIVSRMRLTSIILVVIILFFTALTFYSAYFEKVTDCGCFGDAIPLTPWQSFYKDVILVILILVIFFNFRNYKEYISVKVQNIIMVIVTLGSTAIALFAIWFLPFIDFRSYAVGNDVTALMQPDELAKYEYVMEKDGQEFRLTEYPKAQEGYTFKEAVVMNPKKSEAKIADFSVWNDDGEATDEILTGDKLIVVIHNIEKVSLKNLEEINQMASTAGVETWLLTSSSYEVFDSFRHENQLAFPFYFADETVLKAVVRSNPGILLFKDGVVKGKWHFNSVPNIARVRKLLK
ncbi:MAG: DoxX family protein [Cytophagales bacterium]|nr:DoxX family protein [Cytophagales bacterium]